MRGVFWRFIHCTDTLKGTEHDWKPVDESNRVGTEPHLEHQEVELGGIAAVVVVDGRRCVAHQHGDGVVPPHQLLHDVAHVEPVAVLARKHQHMATESRSAERGRAGRRTVIATPKRFHFWLFCPR